MLLSLYFAKARGVKLGLNGARLAAANHADAVAWASTVEQHVLAARESGAKTLTAIAAYLNQRGIPSREGKRWHPSNVARTVRKLHEAESTSANTDELRASHRSLPPFS